MERKSTFSIIVYIIVGLAIIGLISSLIRNPVSLFISLFVAIGIGVVLYFILTTVLRRRSQGTSDEMKKYRKAVKQSKLKYNNKSPKRSQTNQKTRPSAPVRTKKKRRNAPHLTVIEGKKTDNDKDKNQASN